MCCIRYEVAMPCSVTAPDAAPIVWLAYDWLLCLGEEVQLVWSWKSRRTGASLVYALSRYMLLAQNLLALTTIAPMSTLVRSHFIILSVVEKAEPTS